MDMTFMDRLRPIGFTPAVAQAMGTFNALGDMPGSPVRLIEAHRETVRVTEALTSIRLGRCRGLVRSLMDTGDALTVGDWLWVHHYDHGVPWVRGRMPPFTQIVRRNSSGERQSLVSNVDTAMLTMGLDGDFNLRRLERYLAMVKPAGIWPIVILTKRDLCDDVDARLDALRERLPHDIAVHAVDARGDDSDRACALSRRGADHRRAGIFWRWQVDAHQHAARRASAIYRCSA